MEVLGRAGTTYTIPSTPNSPQIGTSRGKERLQIHSYFGPTRGFNMIVTCGDSSNFLFQIRSEGASPEDQLNQLLLLIAGMGGLKLGRCIPSECSGEDAAKV